MTDLTCRQLVEIVTDYLEGAMPTPERRSFEEHLGACDGCDAYLDQMRQTLRLVGVLTEDSLSPRAEADLLQAFQDWNAHRPPADR